MAPAEGAKPIRYLEIQGDDVQAIYDSQRSPMGLISTVDPLIQIFHPIFDEFIHFINKLYVQPTIDDLTLVQEFTYFASDLAQMEDWHNRDIAGLCKCLGHILQAEVHEEPNLDGTKSDRIITLQIDDAHIAPLILKLKQELSEGESDLTTQREAIREKCCRPTFLVGGGGPWLIWELSQGPAHHQFINMLHVWE
ncbi:hypothetical protein CVT25_009277 [Psilocybe cyanescens]|uniref:Uncharacterized protein n=1 Tax=Psilocybe cyanescens TaxID=93625 RepID=A0A409WWA1_PSICY|nr:hypothetical protein CVT25_009277 [Psilocybe cyanescens]